MSDRIGAYGPNVTTIFKHMSLMASDLQIKGKGKNLCILTHVLQVHVMMLGEGRGGIQAFHRCQIAAGHFDHLEDFVS